MDIAEVRQLIEEYVDSNNAYGDKLIEYESYISINQGIEPLLQGNERSLKEIVSMVVWSTDCYNIQHLIYLTMSGHQSHACRIHFPSPRFCTMHSHNYIELSFILQGRLIQKIENRNVTFEKGEICLINSHTRHSEYIYSADCVVLFLQIDDIFLEKYTYEKHEEDFTVGLKKLINQERTRSLYVKFSPIKEKGDKTEQAFLSIFQEMLDNLPGKKRLITGFTERIIDLLTKEYRLNVATANKSDLYKALTHDICDYIGHQYPTVTVKDISDT